MLSIKKQSLVDMVYEKLREKLAELKEREKKLLQEFSDIGEFAKKRLTLEE